VEHSDRDAGADQRVRLKRSGNEIGRSHLRALGDCAERAETHSVLSGGRTRVTRIHPATLPRLKALHSNQPTAPVRGGVELPPGVLYT
jgi:hypothetical protein